MRPTTRHTRLDAAGGPLGDRHRRDREQHFACWRRSRAWRAHRGLTRIRRQRECRTRQTVHLRSAGAVAQHDAGAAGAADTAAQRPPPGACRRRPAPGRTAGCRGCATSLLNRLGSRPVSTLGVALGEHRVVRQRMVAREAGGELHAPRRCRPRCSRRSSSFCDERIGRAMQQRHQLRRSSAAAAAPARACRCAPTRRPRCR